MIIDRNGILLKEKVNMDFLKNLEPQFFNSEGYIKFVIDGTNNNVAIGMEIHRDCLELLAQNREYSLNFDDSDVWGGNLYYDGTIKWTSALNDRKNLKLREWGESPREITNLEVIERLTSILRSKIDF